MQNNFHFNPEQIELLIKELELPEDISLEFDIIPANNISR